MRSVRREKFGKKEVERLKGILKTDDAEMKELYTGKYSVTEYRAVEIPCPTCPTWSHFIQDKLKISIYLPLDKYKFLK